VAERFERRANLPAVYAALAEAGLIPDLPAPRKAVAMKELTAA
jgi:hypothetical protein